MRVPVVQPTPEEESCVSARDQVGGRSEARTEGYRTVRRESLRPPRKRTKLCATVVLGVCSKAARRGA